MRSLSAWSLAAALVAGCATQPQPAPQASGSAAPAPAASTTQAPPPSGGASFLSVIGTPFLIAFKIPVCVLTVAVAAPIAGVSEMAGADGGTRDTQHQLAEGINENCGPPWAVQP